MSAFVRSRVRALAANGAACPHQNRPNACEPQALPYFHCPWREILIFEPSHAWVCFASISAQLNAGRPSALLNDLQEPSDTSCWALSPRATQLTPCAFLPAPSPAQPPPRYLQRQGVN